MSRMSVSVFTLLWAIRILLLDAAQLHIVARQFGERRNERAAALIGGRIAVGIGGFDLRRTSPQMSSSQEASKPC